MKLFNKHGISLNDFNKYQQKILISLAKWYEGCGELTEKQNDTLFSVLNKEIQFELPELKKIQIDGNDFNIPLNFSTDFEVNQFLQYYDDFLTLIDKLETVSTIRNKNNCVIAIKSILNKQYSSGAINKALGRLYK